MKQFVTFAPLLRATQRDSARRNFIYTQLTFVRKICNLKPLPTLQCMKKLVKKGREKVMV
jgi:hypothetical protein